MTIKTAYHKTLGAGPLVEALKRPLLLWRHLWAFRLQFFFYSLSSSEVVILQLFFLGIPAATHPHSKLVQKDAKSRKTPDAVNLRNRNVAAPNPNLCTWMKTRKRKNKSSTYDLAIWDLKTLLLSGVMNGQFFSLI
jgi:hypothetical protein